jgi:ubiquinone/menaquinone biosynthesis C-methylase UbiE
MSATNLNATNPKATSPAAMFQRVARTQAAEDFFSTVEQLESSMTIDDDLAAKLKTSSSDMYNALAARAPRFWNWGFYRNDIHMEMQQRLPGYHFETDGYSEQLYYCMMRHVRVEDHPKLTILEIGSGAGNGLNLLSRIFGFKAAIGVDLSEGAVCVANAKFARPGLRFLQGDAENLPLGDGEVDLVLNVESSHCYPNPTRFLEEVARVLRPGGHFAHSDAFTRERRRAFESAMRNSSSFEWLESVDISRCVKDAISRRMAPDSLVRKLIRQRRPSWWSSALKLKFFPLLAHEVLTLRTYGSQFIGYEHGIQEKLVNLLSSDRAKDYHSRIEAYVYHLGRKL